MMRFLSPIVGMVLLLAALPAMARDIEGTYDVKGSSGGSFYFGTAVIKKTEETYGLSWTYSDDQHQGTGILVGNVLAATFPGGVVAYEIQADGTLKGQWALDGGVNLSTETLTPK